MKIRDIESVAALAVNAASPSPDDPYALVTQPVLLDLATIGLVDNKGVPTEKGLAYIAALEAVPLPVQRWVIPEKSDAVAQSPTSAVHGDDGAQPGASPQGRDLATSGAGVQPRRRSKRNAESGDASRGTTS